VDQHGRSLVQYPHLQSSAAGSFETVRAPIRHVERYIAEWNSHPNPKALRRAH
jgi:hypothetical protein